MASSDTPKYWKQYLKYINDKNKQRSDSYIEFEASLQKEYDALPWYKKIFAQDPSQDIWGEWNFIIDKQPDILDYYWWDVNVRQKRSKK